MLKYLGLHQISHIFADRSIKWPAQLILLDDEDLREMLVPQSCRRKILRYVTQLNLHLKKQKAVANNSR